MEMTALHACTIGLDIHHGQITACVLKNDANSEARSEFKVFGTFKRDLRALADWVVHHQPDDVVMESTGI